MKTEIIKIEKEIKNSLRELEKLSGKSMVTAIEIPAGIIPIAKEIRHEYRFLKDKKLLKNIPYAIQSLQFHRWILNRLYLYGPVKSYLIKICIVLAFMIVEGLMHDLIKQKGEKPSEKTNKNLELLEKKCLISPSMCNRIKKLHDRRSNIHLHLVSDSELSKYTADDWHKSMNTLRDFLNEIQIVLNV